MTLSFEACRVRTGHDEEGMLVLDEERRLVAVLVRLSESNEVAPGRWFLEVGFGEVPNNSGATFAGLDEAEGWISGRLDGRPRR